MRLYVHFEPSDEALAWTKRLNLPPVGDIHACPSVRSALYDFFFAYNSKFHPKTLLEPENVDVYVEFNQNAASRRLLPSLDVLIAAVGLSSACIDELMLKSGETCEFEIVVIPKESQRKVLGPEPPPCINSMKTSSINTGTSKDDSRGPKLCGILELAADYMKQKKFRAAREIYREVMMIKDPNNPEALVALGEILMANAQHEEAVKKYFLKCWTIHGGANCACARLAFRNGLRLAECYIELGKFMEAVAILDEVQTFLRMNTGSGGFVNGENNDKVFFLDADERLRIVEQMDVLKAQALYETKDFDNQEKAISLITHLLPDLQAPTLNLDALLLYARIAHDQGKKSEALSMALRVLVGKPNGRAVNKALVLFLKDSGSMERLRSAVPPSSPSAGAAYAFIATILKDFSEVEKSIVCFQQAQTSDVRNASYALNHAHALEVCCRYADAYNVLVSFFRKNHTLSVGNDEDGSARLLAGVFVEILHRTNAWDGNYNREPDGKKDYRWRIDWVSGHEGYAKVTPPTSKLVGNVAPISLRTVDTNKRTALTLPEMELDLLACFFTIVKILFINGRLSVLPSLIRLLEPLRLGRELHRTTIRNEHAYYACIAQLLSIEKELVPYPSLNASYASADTIYVCGDSHTLPTAWRKIKVFDQPTLLHPVLVTGLKHWHLRKESAFYPKLNFWRVVESIPHKSRVIFLFGEIDCREGILDAVEKCKYETVEKGMAHTIGIFMEVLAEVVDKYAFDTYINPVVPGLDETRSLVVRYNKIFQDQVAKSTFCKWLDFFDDLVCEVPLKLKTELQLDGTHLHPSYLSKLEAALNKQNS